MFGALSLRIKKDVRRQSDYGYAPRSGVVAQSRDQIGTAVRAANRDVGDDDVCIARRSERGVRSRHEDVWKPFAPKNAAYISTSSLGSCASKTRVPRRSAHIVGSSAEYIPVSRFARHDHHALRETAHAHRWRQFGLFAPRSPCAYTRTRCTLAG